ncbi:MAG: peptidylprolyl isomerase [Candidatus Omnitrophica bacterium]|nr:peptidylprolyl isomerase [Candidatus Omnitrophota bacterium]
MEVRGKDHVSTLANRASSNLEPRTSNEEVGQRPARNGRWFLAELFRIRLGPRPWMLGLLLVVCRAAGAGAESVNRIVAVVNNDVITEGDVTAQMSSLLRDEELPAPDVEKQGQMRSALLERLIDQRLIVQEARRKGLSVSSTEVAERLQQLRERLQTKEAYEQLLRESSLSEEQLKTKMREQLLAQKAIDQEVRAKVVVTPGELSKAVGRPVQRETEEEVQAFHALIRVSPQRPVEQALALATDLRRRIDEGEAFEKLARDYSDDPHAQDGGLLGWIRPGELLPELDRALFALKPQEVSAPVQTQLGIHLLKAGPRRPISNGAMEDPRQQLQARVYQNKFTELMHHWLDGLRQQAYIQIVAQ